MLNIRKRFFLLLTIVGLLFSIASCTKANDYVEVKFDTEEYVIVVGETIDVVPTVNKGESAGQVDLVYVSQDDSIASYSNAKVTGKSVGQTVVKAYVANKAIAYDTVVITVIQDRLPEMEFVGAEGSILKGKTSQVECTFTPADAEENVKLTYASSDPEVAAIDKNGLITTLKAGKVTITVVAENLLYEKEYRTYKFELEVLESDFTVNYVLDGGTNAATNPAGYNVFNLPIALAEATKEGYTFAGWYDNAAFTGEALTEIPADAREDLTLYAKWDIITYTVSYDLAGGEGAETNPTAYTVADAPVALAAPTKHGYNFLGWYAGENKVEKLTIGNVELVAKWELAEYTISYNLNGGDWSLNPGDLYEYGKDRAAMVDDFLNDAMAWAGKTNKPTCMVDDSGDAYGFANVFSKIYGFFSDAKYAAKWAWLKDYIIESTEGGSKDSLISGNETFWRYSLGAFLFEDCRASWPKSADFTNDELANGFWDQLLTFKIVNKYTINSETIELPVAYKLGQKFLGWYDAEGNKVEKIEKGSAGDLELTAKFELDKYTITYNYNGGLLDNYLYASREAMVDDFLNDAMLWAGKTNKPTCMVDDSGNSYGFANVFTAIYGFFSDDRYAAKWAWLKDYIIESTEGGSKDSLISGSEAFWRYSLGAFLFEDCRASWPKSADFTNDELANGFWDLVKKPGAVDPVSSFVYTDSEIVLPTPAKNGNVFLGWYLNGEKVVSINPTIAKDVVLEAKWSHDPIAVEYVLNEGVLPEGAATTFTYADGLATLPVPTKLGYTFLGWYADAACTEKVEAIEAGLLESVKLYAAWELTVYEITYELNGGQFVRDEVVELYDSFDAFVAEFINDYATLTGVEGITAGNFYGKSAKYGLYSFFNNEEMAAKWGWVLEYVASYAAEAGYTGKAYLALTAGAANFNKYARSNFAALLQETMLTSVSPVSLNFKEVDGEAFWAVCPNKDIQVGTEAANEYTIDQLPIALATPTKGNATFVGWYTNSDLKNGKVEAITLDLIGDITLYARWSDSVISFNTYAINYELNGGTLEVGAPTSYVEETGVALSKGATRLGYEFKGWFLDAACTKAVTEFTALDKGEKTVYAAWEVVEYSIKYNVGEGTLPTYNQLVSGFENPSMDSLAAAFLKDMNAVAQPAVEITASSFTTSSGKGGARSDEWNKFLADDKLWAKWSWLITLIGQLDQNTNAPAAFEGILNDRKVEAGSAGQWFLMRDFAGFLQKTEGKFYYSVAPINFGDSAVQEQIVAAAPEAKYEEILLPTNYTVEDLPYTLAIPTSPKDYEFAGWYNNAELTGEAIYVLPLGTSGNIELWAKYVLEKFDITYELNGGINSDNNPVRFGRDEEIVLSDPLREGYTFTGWELNGEKIDKISLGTTGDLTLVATWEVNEYKIYFDYNDGTEYSEPLTLDEFAEELVKDFNSTGASDAKVTTKEDFKATSHPNIKYVFNKAEMLEKYHWVFVFALEEIKAAAKANSTTSEARYTNTVAMLEGLIAGNTATIGGDYAEGRTAFRFWLEGLMNKKIVGNKDYPFMTDFSVAENLQKFYDVQEGGASMPSQVLEHGTKLPVIEREHYVFVGWFDGETQVETATYEATLVAKWEAAKYNVALDAQGGALNVEGMDLDAFAEELVKDFNSTGASDAKVTTKEDFKATSHPNIKYVFNKAEMLEKYHWVFVLALEEIKAAAKANGTTGENRYKNTVEMLEGLIAGNTATIGGDYAEGRTAFRFWLEGLMNKKIVGNNDYPFMTDFSVAENMERFEAALAAQNSVFKLSVEDKLPTPVRTGYIFLGWFDGDDKVEKVSGDASLTAKWEIIKFKIQYDLNEGSWLEGTEGPTSFEYGQEVVIPEPVKEGYEFLGWTQLGEYVNKIGNENYKLTAKWKEIGQTGFEVIFDLNGGQFEKNLDQFAEELVKDFNSTGASDAVVTTRESFKSTSHPNIKYVFNNTEMLEKYHWLFVFALEEIKAAGEANGVTESARYTNTVEMLEGLIAGNTATIGGGYAEGRTAFRFWLEGLMNHKIVGNGDYPFMLDFSDEYNMEKFTNVYCPVQRTVEPNEELPVAVKENYIFLGWYLDGVKVQNATGDDVLVAEWIHIDEYEWTVEFELDGGHWEGQDLNSFAEELIKDFNSTGKSDAKVTTKENFKGTSHPNIKYVWSNAEMLAKYKWFFEFAKVEMQAAAAANNFLGNEYYTNLFKMLDGMIAGDVNAVNINDGGNARTIFRYWIQGLINENLAPAEKGMYDGYMVDYSVAENIARFNALLGDMDNTYCAKDALPTPVKEGHLFLGWYIGEDLVTAVRSNCTLTAKWVDTATLKYTISYDVAEGTLPEDAKVEFGYNEAVVLPVPTREGYKFLGWYEGETLVEKLENRDYELVAKWEAQNAKAINYELDGGKLPEGAAVEYIVGKGLEILPTPTKLGYEFLGWFADAACTQAITSISAEANEDVTLYAQWKKGEIKIIEVYVGEGKDYATLDEAIAGVADDTRIILGAGEHTLSAVINKSVEIVGPNANKEYAEFSTEEALINVAKDVAGNIAAKSVVFNGVHLLGTGGGAGIPGVFFQDGGNVELLKFVSCEISDMNTFVKFINAGSNADLVIEKSKIHSIGQFIVWTTDSINATILKDSYVDGATCGAVTNANAALFRIRKGTFEAYNNYFNGDSKNAPGYFECVGGPSFVKYNTFNNVTLFAFEEKANQLVFDNNLYLDDKGNEYPAAPSFLKGTGVTADTKVALNAEDLYNSYIKYLKESDPDRYFNVTFDAGAGEITSLYPEVYDSEAGIANLPTVSADGYEFVGWLLNGKLVESVPAGTKGDITLVASYKEEGLYVGEGQQFATIAEALVVAKDGDTIILVAGTYAESFTISLANITVKGPNAGVNPNKETRNAEAVLTGTVTIATAAKNVTIDGLAFTTSGKVYSTTAHGLTFKNNYVYDTNDAAKDWQEGSGYVDGFIAIGETTTSTNLQFVNNKFENVKDVNVNFLDVCDVTFDGNVFKNFSYDAIRFDDSTYNYGNMSFTNNEFVNDTPSGYNGIYFRSYGGPGSNDNVITIKGNKFVNIGNATLGSKTLYTNAISARNNQEHGTIWTIADNYFESCYNYMRIRNNGTAANHTTYKWACTVENNQFIGLPTSYYFAVWNNSDSDPAQNPETTVFGANYYEDNNGAVISDLAAYASYFKNVATKGSALAAKPGATEVKPLEFYSIKYELNGGSTRDTFVYNYSSLNNAVIVLPELTKANHQFNGWLLNGELVKELPADIKGNLELVADFSVLEGEIYNIEFVTNKDNALWPSRAAYDRFEIYDALYADLYEWAQMNGETKSFEDYKAYIDAQLKAYSDIKLRNTELGNYPAEDGSTEYFLNVPKYYQKWSEFFAIFNEAMLKVNAEQNFYKDTYATMVRMHQFMTWSSTGESYFKSYVNKMCVAAKIPQEIPTTYRGGQIVVLPELYMENGLQFLGWYDNAEFTGEAINQISTTDTGDKKFYAKWEQEILPSSIEINKVTEMLLFTTHQLVWSIAPDNATDKSVEFFSSNEEVATVSAKGLITALANGTTTITVKVYGNREIDVVFDLTVYTEDYIDGSYATNSYVEKDDSIQLNAQVVRKDGTTANVLWTSLTPEIATVDANGVVTALKAGEAKIVATDPNNETLTLEFVVVVLEEALDGILGLVVEANNSNVFTRYNLNIGGAYNTDVFGSVSKLLSNYKLTINDKYYAASQQTAYNGGEMTSVEWVTVHYTGNMVAGADAAANASYFSTTKDASIHYTTGNDGIFYCTDEKYAAFHAGDSGSRAQVGDFKWNETGLEVLAGDPATPVITISDDFYYEINGRKTTVKMPNPWNYSSRGTDHILNADGTISSQPAFGQTGFTNRTPESFINNLGLPWKVENGKYYMGTTWWCYTQVYEGRICSSGGNYNSIGIESCVNKGSDLWLTWQMTAKLVADIMIRNELDMTRVKGHHFFSGKNCPQPMLENDCEIWKEFLQLVETEYTMMTEFEGYEVSMKSNNTDIVADNGRVVKQPSETTCVTYTVTITKDGQTQTITLASMVKGLYVGR